MYNISLSNRLKKFTENDANIDVYMTESKAIPKQQQPFLPYKDLGPYLRLTDTALNKEKKKQNKSEKKTAQ